MITYQNDDIFLQTIIILIILVLVHLLFTKLNLSKMVYIIFYAGLAFCLLRLELRYSDNLEKGDHDILRINSDRFKRDPHGELYRYLRDTKYYNNTWRTSAICAIIICIFISVEIHTFPLLFIVVFCIIYHAWNWKLHHTYDFIFKSVESACLHLNMKKDDLFHQEKMIKLESLSNLKM